MQLDGRSIIRKQIRILKEGTPLVRQFFLRVTPTRVDNTLSNTRLFFVVGLGRSGTTFLSHLLHRAPECVVYHEYYGDREALIEAYWNPLTARQYLSGFRKRLVAARIIQSRCQTYGEVNSYLRYHVDALHASWHPILLHLVRDGRAVVRSLMNRKAFSPADRNHTGRLAPPPDDSCAEIWPEMDRFARVCWYWASTNRYLLSRQLPMVRFEEIIGSYEKFTQQVLDPLGISLASETWCEEVAIARNVSQDYRFPTWSDWTSKQKYQFEAICGTVMSRLGYVI